MSSSDMLRVYFCLFNFCLNSLTKLHLQVTSIPPACYLRGNILECNFNIFINFKYCNKLRTVRVSWFKIPLFQLRKVTLELTNLYCLRPSCHQRNTSWFLHFILIITYNTATNPKSTNLILLCSQTPRQPPDTIYMSRKRKSDIRLQKCFIICRRTDVIAGES